MAMTMTATPQREGVVASLLEAKSPHYSLRSGSRRATVVSRRRGEMRPMSFISQSRDRYFSDADDDDSDSSTLISDRETDHEGSDFLPDEDLESNNGSDEDDDDVDNTLRRNVRPQLLDFATEVEMPTLNLPDSSEDLMIDSENILTAVGVYQVLRHFSGILRLSPFRFEDFCAALSINEQSSLLVETHISLLKCILQEEDSSNSTFGPHDMRDSINISLYLIDSLTWFEILNMYLKSFTSTKEIRQVLPYFSCRHYQDLNTSQRLLLLQTLSDLFLATNLVREAIMKEGAFIHEEQCRLCHRRGDLICCETCPAVFHLECLCPPLKSVPEDDWFCSVCSALQVKGIDEFFSHAKKSSLLCRLEPLGFDRHHRRYWLLCRRIFIEGDNRTWYYSSLMQLEELLLCLDGEKWEVELVSVLKDMKDVINDQMAVTEELTNKARGKRKSALTSHDEFLSEQRLKLQAQIQSEKMSNKETDTDEKSLIEPMETTNEKPLLNEVSSLSESFATDASKASDFKGKEDIDCKFVSSLSPEPNTKAREDEVNQTAYDGCMSIKSKQEVCSNANSMLMEETVEECQGGNSNVKTLTSVELSCHSSDALHDSKEQISSIVTDSVAKGSSSLLGVFETRQTRSMSRHLTNFALLESETQSETQMDLQVSLRSTPSLFKLGMEGNYKNYINLFSTNALALSKQQQNEERDKRRHLSYKFSLTPLSDFSWNAFVYGLMRQTIDAVRKSLLNLEANIHPCFLHPNWSQNSGRWQKAVSFCSTASEFGFTLMIFEACMKPLLFNSVWHESLGHIQLHRKTVSEREERKKKEKDLKRFRNEDDYFSGNYVKYSLGLHHQVWKQKGEEYRSTGKGGWYWVSSTRSCHPSLMKCYHLLKSNCKSLNSVSESKELIMNTETVSGSDSSVTKTDDVTSANLFHELSESQEFYMQHLEKDTVKFPDCLNISEALLSRSFYHKRSPIICFLDGLLEKRKNHLELELKQRVSLELAIKKFETNVAVADCAVSHLAPSEKCSENGIDDYLLKANSSRPYIAKLNFSKQISGCLEETLEMDDQEEEDSDHEVTLEKEDLDDNSSVGSSVDHCEIDNVTVSEDSNLSSASSFTNVVPPPIRSTSFEKSLTKQTACNMTRKDDKYLNSIHSEVTGSSLDSLDGQSQIELDFSCNVIYSLDTFIKDGIVLLTLATVKEIKEKLNEIGKTEFPVRLLKFPGKKKKKKMHIRKGGIPLAHSFQTKSSKKSLFVLEKNELVTLARKGGQREVEGFNYNCKMYDVDWPYPCPRPYFKTAWRYRTLMASNISAIALQLRILWSNIRWDDMSTKYPAGKSNSTVTDDFVTTVELLKRRDIGPMNLRAEYLVQKTVSPLEIPTTIKERTLPPQRSGLRERRQPEASILKEPVTSEAWVPEEQLELWEVRLFAERLEKKQHKQRERSSDKKPKAMTPNMKFQEHSTCQSSKANLPKSSEKKSSETSVKTVSNVVEEELQKQRLQMQQKRLERLRGQQQIQQQCVLPLKTKERLSPGNPRPESSQSMIPGSLKLTGRRLITSRVIRPERNFSASTVSSISTTQHFSSAISFVQKPTATVTVASPPLSSSATPNSPLPPPPSAVQSIRIKKGTDGQLQITGLQPGQEIIQLADGRLRLVTRTQDSSSPLSHQQLGHLHVTGSSSPYSSQPQASVVEGAVSLDSKVSLQQEHQNKISINKEPESNTSAEAAEVNSPVRLKSSLLVENESIEVGTVDQQKQLLQPLMPEQQTNATVATAVEKLFACLSPLRLQNKRRSSETKVCEGQSPGQAKHCLNDSQTNDNSFDVAVKPVTSDSSNFSPSHMTPINSTGFMLQQKHDMSTLYDKGKLCQTTTLNVSESDAMIHSVAAANVCQSSNLSGHEEPPCVTYGQLVPISALASGSGGFLIMMQSPSYVNGTLTDENLVKGCVLENSCMNDHNGQHCVSDMPMTKTLSRNSNAMKETCKRKSSELEAEEFCQISKRKALNQKMTASYGCDDDGGDTVKEMLPRVVSTTSPQKPIPMVTGGAVRLKRKLSNTSKEIRGRKQIHKEDYHDSDGAELKVARSCLTKPSSLWKSESVNKQLTDESMKDHCQELFCICRTPYDPSRLYIGCDVCLNWFHASCVNLSKSKVLSIESYVCATCQRQKSEKQELFCICRQPYDKSMFYIGCDDCGGWFHGSCVNVAPTDVDHMDGYRCRVCCLKRDCEGVEVKEEHWSGLKKLISILKVNSMKSCSKSSVVDLSAVERKINDHIYSHLKDFVIDVLKIFNNCYDSNHRASHIIRNITAVEKEFLNNFDQIKTEVFHL